MNTDHLRKISIAVIVLLLMLPALTNAQVTNFNGTLDAISLLFLTEYTTETYFITVPNGTVSEARMRLQGFDALGESIAPADVILVTDVSGSMDDNCPGGDADPGETPCKMNDAKTAGLSFLDNVNLNYIHVGLVKYSTCPDVNLDVWPMTDDYDALAAEINSYTTQSMTNMGGGMELAMDELLSPDAQPGAAKYMLIMTDGLANAYFDDAGDCQTGGVGGRNYVRDIAQQAEANGIEIYGIAFGADADKSLVQEITTNGQLYYAPDAATLLDIYNQIAQSISVQNFSTPDINSNVPAAADGWEYQVPFSNDVYWDNADCGDMNAVCSDYRTFIQDNLDQCAADPCDIEVSVYSPTVGMLNLSELYIEINERPVSNFPPSGTCRDEAMACGDPTFIIDIDDGSLVTDPNDALSDLTWAYDSSLTSPGGSHFRLNPDYNTVRQLQFEPDPAFLDNSYWELFLFNVSDPSGESVLTCVNVSYSGCAEVPPIITTTPVFEISDRTVSFTINEFPGYVYSLTDMIDEMENLTCTLADLEYGLSDSSRFLITGPDAAGQVTIVPSDPDWFNPTSDNIEVNITCRTLVNTSNEDEWLLYGYADVILVTDFSGSMKKAVNSWDQGTGRSDCAQLYTFTDARKSHLARCLNAELVDIVMNFTNNRIWPLFIHSNQIDTYSGDPFVGADIRDYIINYGPQGTDQTCLPCAINAGHDILTANYRTEGKRFILLMTDGVPTHCADGSCSGTSSIYGVQQCAGFCDTNGQSGCGASAEGCEDNLCQIAEDNTLFSTNRAVDDLNTTFFTVGFGLVENCSRSQALLGQIALLSGGEYYHSIQVDELRAIYHEIARIIVNLTRVYEEGQVPRNLTRTATLTLQYGAVSALCWNGELDPDEECDDGNLDNTDTCTNICTLTYCSDGIPQQPNGYGRMEVCDDGNLLDEDGCDSNCTLEFCGDGITQVGLGEECDDSNNNNNDGCDGFCQLEPEPVLSILDQTIVFDYSSFPGGYDYNLADMLSPFAILPCEPSELSFVIDNSTGFSISDPLGQDGAITIVPDSWFLNISDITRVTATCINDAETYTDEAYLNITYLTDGAPEGSITCLGTDLRYVLHTDEDVFVALNSIFDFQGEYGIVNTLSEDSSGSFDLAIVPPDTLSIVSDGAGYETIRISVSTSNGIISETCELIAFNPGTFCDAIICRGCGDYTCLETNNCFDSQFRVFNPFIVVEPTSLLPAYAPADHTIDSFLSLDSDFMITSLSEDRFRINATSADHATLTAGITEISFDGFINNPMRVCHQLVRFDYDIGFDVDEPETELLLASSRAVTGYYEYEGTIQSIGPYIFTARVWLRE